MFFHKENSKVLLFEKDRGFLCNPIGCNSACTFVLSNRNTETTFTPFKWQYFTALFFQKMLLRRGRLVFFANPEYQRKIDAVDFICSMNVKAAPKTISFPFHRLQ